MRSHHLLLALFLVTSVGDQARAQEPARADSLAREIARLRARIDSLQVLVQRLIREGRDTAPAGNALERLRAAARAAAARRPDSARTAPERRFVRQSANLNRLNPEISVTGDVRVQTDPDVPNGNNVDLREFEFSFQSVLDPFASTKIFLAFEDGEIDLEEAYAYWTGLPGGLRLDVGRLRQPVGELNRWHLHALPQSEYPLVYNSFFGEEGLIANGIGLYWVVPVGGGALGAHELWGQVALGENEELFADGNRLSFLGHLNNFWQVSRSVYFQLGGTLIYGDNPEANLQTTVYGADVRVTWRPPDRAMYRSFTLRGEGYGLRQNVGGIAATRYGAFVAGEYQLTRRLFLGSRFDYVESATLPDVYMWAVTPTLTWWQSEWVRIRAEWGHLSTPLTAVGRETGNRLLIQAVWSVGPHKHETY